MYQRILIATDGSKLSNKAVKDGLELAAQCGANVVALKVVPRYPRSYFEGGLPVDPSSGPTPPRPNWTASRAKDRPWVLG
jgi:nucleotide-binding universal stress UspA family protein